MPHWGTSSVTTLRFWNGRQTLPHWGMSSEFQRGERQYYGVKCMQNDVMDQTSWTIDPRLRQQTIDPLFSVDQSSWTIDPCLWWKTIDPLFLVDQSSFHLVDQQSAWINRLVFISSVVCTTGALRTCPCPWGIAPALVGWGNIPLYICYCLPGRHFINSRHI